MRDRLSAARIRISFERRPVSARLARDAMVQLLGDRAAFPFVRDALLLTSELVSNAVTHGSGACELRAAFATPPDHLRVEVRDDSTDMPILPDPTKQGAGLGGHGLALVAEVASDWGVNVIAAGGKSVWFELTSPPG